MSMKTPNRRDKNPYIDHHQHLIPLDFKPDLPFDFRFSYTESSPDVRPIGLREPKYSPFGPSRIDRVWTGVRAPVIDPIVKSVDDGNEGGVNLEEKRKKLRDDILEKPLSDAERKILLDKCQRVRTKQINLGRDGFTHNILNDIHNNWKTCEAARIRCLGVPTVNMKNVCNQLERHPSCCVGLRLALFLELMFRNRFRDLSLETFKKEQIVIWRGKNYTAPEPGQFVNDDNSFDYLVGRSSNGYESSSSEDELLSSDSKLFAPPIR
ncbi:hypothetical protein MKW92_044350 [Papaver armeniacum]|nr:hypothetical protein MKW92_044350 [Papaver armeniacum]